MVRFGDAAGLLVANTTLVEGTIDLAGAGRLEVRNQLVLSSGTSGTVLRGAAREHVTAFAGATSVPCTSTFALEDVVLAADTDVDLTEGPCTLVVDDLSGTATSSITLGPSQLIVEGTCSGGSFCP